MSFRSQASLRLAASLAALLILSACDGDAPVPLSGVEAIEVPTGDAGPQANQNIANPTLEIPVTYPVEEGDELTLVWEEKFDGPEIDPEVWFFATGDGTEKGLSGGWGNNELQYYLPDNAMIVNGVLEITARRETVGNLDYTSARINTEDRFAFQYGRIEASIKLPSGQGLWPAFWMLSQSEDLSKNSDYLCGGDECIWAATGEIDIMEAVNLGGTGANEIFGTIHYGGESPANQRSETRFTPSVDVTDDFHTYALEWDEDEIRWYFDGRLYAMQNQNTWFSTADNGGPGAPFNQPFHILLNLAVGGNFPGSPNGITPFPATMEVDWVRVYSGEGPPADAGAVPQNAVFVTDPNVTADLAAPMLDNFGSGATFNAFYAGDPDFKPTLQVISGNAYEGNPDVGFVAFTGYEAGFAADFETLSFKVKGLPGDELEVKFFGSPENSIIINLGTYAGATDLGNGWYQVTIPMSEFAANAFAFTGFLIGPPGDQGAPFSFLLTDIGFNGSLVTTPADPGTTPEVTLYARGAVTDLVFGEDYTEVSVFGSVAIANNDNNADVDFSPAFSVSTGFGYDKWNAQLAFLGFDAGFAASYVTLDFKVKGMAGDLIRVKLLNDPNPDYVDVDLTSSDYATLLGNGWYQVVVPIADIPGDVATASGLLFETIEPAPDASFTFLLNDIGFSGPAGGGDTGGGDTGGVATLEVASNGGFETGDLTGWAQDATTGGIIEVVDTGASTGTYAARLVAGVAQSPLIKQLQLAAGAVGPNETVEISFDMKGTITGAGGVVFAEFFSEGDPVAQQFLGGGPLLPTADWATYSYTITTGPDVSRGITLQLLAVCGADECEVEVFFDNVSILIVDNGDTGGGDTGGGDTGATGSCGGSEEQALNCDFETGDLTGWTVFGNGGLVEVVDTGVGTGPFAVNLVAGPGTNPLIKQFELATGVVAPGDTVNISFDMKGTLSGEGGEVIAEFFSEGEPTTSEILNGGPIIPTANWATYTDAAVAGSDVSRGITLQLVVVCGANPGCEADVFIDNVSIVIGGGGDTGGGDTGGGDTGGVATLEVASNGGFETGDLTGWAQDATTGGIIEVVDTGASTGTYAARLVAGVAQSPLIKQLQLAAGAVGPNETVEISFDMKGTITGAGGVVFAEFFSEGDPVAQQFLGGGPLLPTADWATYSYTITTGPDVSRGITLQLLAVCGADECEVEVFFDNVSILIVDNGDTGGGDTGGGDTGATGSCGGSEEQALNCDFETGDLTGWTVFGNGGLVEVVDTGVGTGPFAVNLVAGPGTNPLIKQFELATGVVAPGDTVNISFDMKGTLSGEGGEVIAEFFSEGEPTTSEILNGGPIIPTANWATYTDAAVAGSDVSRGITLQLVVVCGANPGCEADVFIDNVSIVIPGVDGPGDGGGDTGGGDTGGGTVLITFDESMPPSVTPFVGAVATLEAGPAGGGSNDTLKILRDGGGDRAGVTILFPNGLVPGPGTQTISAEFYSPTAGIPVVAVMADVNNNGTGDVLQNETVVVGWQTLTWTFIDLGDADYDKIAFIPNEGTVDATAISYFFDNITLLDAGDTGGGDTGGGDTVLATFDEVTPPVVNEFGGSVAVIEAGPAGGDGNALNITRNGGFDYAGAWFSITPIPSDAGTQTVSAFVYSPTAAIPIAAKAEFGEDQGTGDVQANEAVVVGWQTLTWTFSNLDPAQVYNRFVMLPNLGTVDTTSTSYFFDNITLLGTGGGG